MSRRLASRCLVAAMLVVLVLSLAVGPAMAASPAPGSGGVGDTRSSGQGAGFAGEPILAAVAVIALGVVTAGATTAIVRLTRAR
jgi:hypothetical protein